MAGRWPLPRGAGKARAMHRTLPAIAGDFAAGRLAARGSMDRDGGTPKATGVGTGGKGWNGWNATSGRVSAGASVRQPCEGRVGGEGNAPGGRVPPDGRLRRRSLGTIRCNRRLRVRSLGILSPDSGLAFGSLGTLSPDSGLTFGSLGFLSRDSGLECGNLRKGRLEECEKWRREAAQTRKLGEEQTGTWQAP